MRGDALGVGCDGILDDPPTAPIVAAGFIPTKWCDMLRRSALRNDGRSSTLSVSPDRRTALTSSPPLLRLPTLTPAVDRHPNLSLRPQR